MPADDATLTAIRELAVQLANVAADVRAIRDRLDVHDRARVDFDIRLRAIETGGCPTGSLARAANVARGNDLETRVRSLERWRWSIPSLAALLGIASFGVSVWAVAYR